MHVRRVLLVALLPLLGAASAAALLVPPALAQAPSAPLPAESAIPVRIGDRLSASVTVSAGWTRIGAGPFPPEERAILVAPDGVYRVELELVPGPPAGEADGAAAAVPGALGKELQAQLGGVAWSRETLVGGNQARYASFPEGDTAVTVVIVDPPLAPLAEEDENVGARLVLVASAPVDDARRYRTVTADLAASARFPSPEQAASSEGRP